MIIWILLLSGLSSCSGTASDVLCFQTLKQSLFDPNGALSSWEFNSSGTVGYICQFNGVECWHPSESRVLFLNLGNMGLEGSFPQGVQNCSSMTLLDLSNNSLSGPLPGDIARQLPFITSLNLSHNSFSGEIPSGVGNLSYLYQLSLEHNRFTGRLPETMGDRLSRLALLNVADNSLSGPIPGSLQKFSAEDFAGNDGLCGAPLGKCKRRFHVRIRARPVRIHLRLRRVNDASSIGGAVGFVVGFVVAFYFPRCFVFCGSLRPYVFPVCA
ncbi:probably inactive leucine-rich repeat receptor-like protein kinase At5g48380 [Miscanthus floridulus]|uniref:probably inactive leucine-rich repeat receptor-like protein kinase At5g48380 n=1 Tax=Miscanthus floridulus TaxID=154761 RepID=UPI0034589521